MPYYITTATEKIAALKKRIRAIQGGTSAGKTIAAIQILIDLAQSDKVPTITSITSESMPHLKRGAIRDFLNIMQEHKYYKDDSWNKSDYIYTFETGSKIEFFSTDMQDKVRGPRRDRWFGNEINNVSLETFEQMEVRTKEFVMLDWNPTNEFWFYTDVKPGRLDIDHIILTYKDNEALDPNIVASIEQRMHRKGWWTVYGMGELGEVDGKIYKDWTIIDDIPQEARMIKKGLDFGYSNDPSTLVDIYKWNDAYVIDEVLYQKGLSNKQLADVIGERNIIVAADGAEPKSIDEIASYGVPIVAAPKGADSVKYGIQLVQDAKIFVTKRSVNIIKEYRNYLWMTDKNGQILQIPEHQFSHSMDAIRYAFALMFRDSIKTNNVTTIRPVWKGFNRR